MRHLGALGILLAVRLVQIFPRLLLLPLQLAVNFVLQPVPAGPAAAAVPAARRRPPRLAPMPQLAHLLAERAAAADAGGGFGPRAVVGRPLVLVELQVLSKGEKLLKINAIRVRFVGNERVYKKHK